MALFGGYFKKYATHRYQRLAYRSRFLFFVTWYNIICKFRAPNARFQTSANAQLQNSKNVFHCWYEGCGLGVGTCVRALEFVWNLEFVARNFKHSAPLYSRYHTAPCNRI